MNHGRSMEICDQVTNRNRVRMTVGTPDGEEQWKNVEITGYAKVTSADSDSDDFKLVREEVVFTVVMCPVKVRP